MSDDFIPDNQFVPDQEPIASPQQREPAAVQPDAPDFVPDSQFQSDEDKYSTPTQHLKTLGEGVAKGFLGPVAPYVENKIFGNAKEQLAREEENPVTHGAGEIGSLVGGAVTGTGLGGVLSKIGEAAEVGAGAMGLGKIGSNVVKGAIENLAYQTQSEASKAILQDPMQSADSAITDIGLATLLGGGFGTVPALWKAAGGTKTAQMLGSIANKLGGIEGIVPDAVENTIAKTGMELAPEIKAGLSGDPQIQTMFKTLQQTDSNASGLELQKTYNNFRNDAGHALITALGKTPEKIQTMGPLSKYTTGKAIGDTLAKEYEAQVTPLSEAFDNLKSKFKDVELMPTVADKQELFRGAQQTIAEDMEKLQKKLTRAMRNGDPAASIEHGAKIEAMQQELRMLEMQKQIPGTIDSISDKIAKAAIDQGWATSPSSDMMKLVNTTMKELPLQKNLKNLGDFISQVGANANKDPMNGSLRRAGGILTKILKEAEADVIGAKLGETEGPLAVQAFQQARAGYATQAALKEAIDSRLHAGGSTSGFAKSIRSMAQTDGESVLRRLSGAGDADLLQFMQQHYPETAKLIKDYHVNNLLSNAAEKAKTGMTINSEAFLKGFKSMSPELRNFVADSQAQGKIGAVGELLGEFNKLPHNFSNTARTADSLLHKSMTTVMGLATGLATHSPLIGGMVAAFGKTLGKDVPDAIKLGLLKFLGSSSQVDAAGFKNMVEFINHAAKADSMINRATKNVFKAGVEVIPQHLMPKDSDRAKLSRSLDEIQQKPEMMLNVAGRTGTYMPDHAAAIGATAARAVEALKGRKPNSAPQNPLDTKRELSPDEKARYNRALDIAQQPLVILQHIAEGRLTPDDVQLQKTIYPNLYNKLANQLMDHATKQVAKGVTIPYAIKMGLSLYLGQAMDSTMTSQGIMAAQPKPQQNQQQTATQPASSPKRSTASLNKMPSMYRTPGQEAERDRNNRHDK